MIEQHRSVSVPTIQARVTRDFRYGGRWLEVDDLVWLTQSDLRAYAAFVCVVLELSPRTIERRMSEGRDFAERLRR